MTNEQPWETVGRPKKVKETKRISAAREKELVAKMPRIEAKDPIQLDDTLFSVFDKKEKPEVPAADAKVETPQNGNKKSANPKKKKPDDSKKKPKPMDLPTVLSQLSPKDLESVLNKSQSYFPNHPVIWLKDLASYLNIQLQNCPDPDPVYRDKPVDFPLSAVTANYAKVLHSFMKKFPDQILDGIYSYGIQTMLQDSAKGIPVHGYKLFLQLISHTKPDIAIDKLPQYLEMLKVHHTHPSRCLSILWVLGQCGFHKLNYGLKVWLDLMLPALEVRQVAYYPVEYLEALMKLDKKSPKKAYGLVTLREYFQVLDVFFTPQFALADDLRKRLVACYPFIRKLAYGEAPSHNLRTFFPSYLARFSSTNSQPLKNQLLECMTHCLITDKQSFSVWCQLYTKHLMASGHLLSHINRNWGKLSSKLDKNVLKETLRSFSVTNEELEGNNKAKRGDLKMCLAATKNLMSKMAGRHFPWSSLFFFLVTVVAAIVIYDVASSPGFRLSKTMQFLEHYRILVLLENTYQCVNNAVTMSMNWLKVNFPLFFAYVRDNIGPFMLLVWETTKDFVINAEIISRPYRALMMEKATHFYYWVYELSPEFWVQCGEFSWLAWEVLKDYTLRIWKHSLHFAGEANHWLTEHVMTGSFSKQKLTDTALWGVEHLQNCTSLLVSWTKSYFLATK